MEEMRGIESGSDEWVAKMTVLIENVEHHAEEEEQDLFPDTRRALGDDRIEALGGELEARKATLKAGRGHQGTSSTRRRRSRVWKVAPT